MLKRNQILPYLETRLECADLPRKSKSGIFTSMSHCHRLLAVALLLGHYRRDIPKGITCMYGVLPFSAETIRRAVKDGVAMGVIDVVNGGDKRYKKIKASQELVDRFEDVVLDSSND